MTTQPMKTVDLDAIIDMASQYRKLREPLWPMDQINRSSGLHGEDTILFEDDVVGATRPWRSLTVIVGQGLGGAQIPVVRFRSVPRSQQRGFVRIPGAAVSIEWLEPRRVHGQFMLARQFGEWLVVGQDGKQLGSPHRDSYLSKAANMGFGLVLLHEYTWSAVFAIPGHAPFCIPTDARGALVLFKLRDKPEDGRRRPALRHWVGEHLRTARSSDEMIGVKEHLKGRQSFTWSGIDVELRPSPYDQERAMLATRPMPIPKARR